MPDEAAYAVTLAHRIRFTMVLNAREAMHLIELRSQPQGHESYRGSPARCTARSPRSPGTGDRGDDDLRRRSDPAAGRLAAERGREARRARG